MANESTVDSATLVEDAEARLDFLVEHDVVSIAADDTVALTDDFEHSLSVYEDTYDDVTQEEFRETVAEVFDLTEAETDAAIDERGLTRQGLSTFLALRSYLDDDLGLSSDALLMLTGMATQVGARSPIPDILRELTDDDYEAFIESEGDVVVFVFQKRCPPCEQMKDDLGDILAPLSDVAVAAVDGKSVTAFRREFEVEAAPTTLVFADGELVASERGARTPEELAEVFAEHYDWVDVDA